MTSSPPTTAQRILDLLNREPLSVGRLAEQLGISRNSTYVQVSRLEAAGALEKTTIEPTGRAGKPAVGYRTVPSHEDTFSNAYKPVLAALLDTLGDRLSVPERRELLDQAGRHLAGSAGLEPSGDFDEDLRRALEAVNGLGALAEVVGPSDGPRVRCHSCPLATAVHQDPSMCTLVAGYFSAATRRPVTVQCRHDDTVVCGFAFGSAG